MRAPKLNTVFKVQPNINPVQENKQFKMTIILKDKRKEQGIEGKQTSEPEKAHSTGDFVIVANGLVTTCSL